MITRELLEELGFTLLGWQNNDNLSRLTNIALTELKRRNHFSLMGQFENKPSWLFIAGYRGPNPELVLAQLKLALNS